MKKKIKKIVNHVVVITIIIASGVGAALIMKHADNNVVELQKTGEALIVKNGNTIDVYHIVNHPDKTTTISKNLEGYPLSDEAKKLCLSSKSGVYYSEIERSGSLSELLPVLIIFLIAAFVYTTLSYAQWWLKKWQGKLQDKKHEELRKAGMLS